LFNSQSAIRNPKFDAVINLAARAGVRQSIENPWIYFETNVITTDDTDFTDCRDRARG